MCCQSGRRVVDAWRLMLIVTCAVIVIVIPVRLAVAKLDDAVVGFNGDGGGQWTHANERQQPARQLVVPRFLAAPPLSDISHVSSDDHLWFELQLGDNKPAHVLEMWPNTNLLSARAVIEYVNGGRARRETSAAAAAGNSLDVSCFYQGHVWNSADRQQQDSSSVALSVCHGLKGYVIVSNKTYLIEPVAQPAAAAAARPARARRSVRDAREYFAVPHVFYELDASAYRRPMSTDRQRHESPQSRLNNTDLNHRRRLTEHANGRRRSKRSLSIERHIETLVVADQSMVQHFRQLNQSLETYLLTILNMVSTIYKHPSIGAYFNLAVVRMQIIEDNNGTLEIDQDVLKSLQNFCDYQKRVNYISPHPLHHDVALLISQIDFCSDDDEACETLGLGKMGGMCDPDACCNVNQNTGLSLAFTVAHELGHNLNADHDDELGCRVSAGLPIMATNVKHEHTQFEWSECSKRAIRSFLDEGHADCLLNEPSTQLLNTKTPQMLSGLIYSVDEQCKIQFGVNSSFCKDLSPPRDECRRLWCRVGNEVKCHTANTIADGSSCRDDNKHWCQQGLCVEINLNDTSVQPVDGNWSDWSTEWTACTHECNGGIQHKERFCNNPSPTNGGKYCLGETQIYRMCNPQPCHNTTSGQLLRLRNEQCSKVTNTTSLVFGIKPSDKLDFFFNREYPCKLFCKPEENNIYYDFMTKVEDGSRCRAFSNDVCINGFCHSVGCDMVLNSNATEDRCGVCNGDNSTCAIVQGRVEFRSTMRPGYHAVTIIPVGAENIEIVNDNTLNYLAIHNTATNKYYLNGDYAIVQASFDFIDVEDFSLAYDFQLNREIIKIKGPISIPLAVQVSLSMLFQAEKSTLTYTFSRRPASNTPLNATQTHWVVGNWSNTCTKNPCANETRIVRCLRLSDTSSETPSETPLFTAASTLVDAENCTEQDRPVSQRQCPVPDGFICKQQAAELFAEVVGQIKYWLDTFNKLFRNGTGDAL